MSKIFCSPRYWLVALCMIGFVQAAPTKEEVDALIEELHDTEGASATPEAGLDLLHRIKAVLSPSDPLYDEVKELIEVSHVSSSKCGFSSRSSLYNLVNRNLVYTNLSAYLQHYKEEQDNVCVEDDADKTNPFF